MRRTAGALVLLASACALALPAPASATVTCAFVSEVIVITSTSNVDNPELKVNPSTTKVEVTGSQVGSSCADLPEANKAAGIDFNQSGTVDGQMSIRTSTPFAPGLGGDEGGGQHELEIDVDMGGGYDTVQVFMGDGDDNARLGELIGGSQGINLNAGAESVDPDGDDVRMTAVEELRALWAGFGTDSNVIDARGGPEFSGAFSIPAGIAGSTGGNDELSAGTAGGGLSGFGGDDTLRGGPGPEYLRGGTGHDTLTYDNASSGVTVNLTTDTVQNTGGGGNDTLDHADNPPGDTDPDFEDLIGSSFDDNLTGSNAANDIEGGTGVDAIAALDGNDNVRVDDAVAGDRADCGAGIDFAAADSLGPTPLDVLIDCESTRFVDRSPPPSSPGPSGSGPPGATIDTTRPAFLSLSLSPSSFLAARSGPGLLAATVGTRVRYALSEPATVTFRVERSRPGRRVGRRCRPPTARNRRRRRCTRYVLVRGQLSRAGAAGANTVRFMGRLAGRRLRRGRYRLVLTATDAAGNRSASRRVRFRIR
jgi:hypothetical protein